MGRTHGSGPWETISTAGYKTPAEAALFGLTLTDPIVCTLNPQTGEVLVYKNSRNVISKLRETIDAVGKKYE